MIEFVTLASRVGETIDRTLLEPLATAYPRGSLFRAVHTELHSEQGGQRLTLVRASQHEPILAGRDGAWAVFDGIAIGRSESGASADVTGLLASAFRSMESPRDVEALTDSLRGNFIICASLPDGTIVAIADPLGTYPFFIASTPQFHVVSNNALLVEAALAESESPTQRSATGLGMEAVFGSGAFGSTGFDNVRLAPPGHLVLLRPNGDLSTSETASRQSRYRPGEEAASLLDRAADQIAENVRALSAGPTRTRLADLTGGVDSRTVLAALLAEGAERQVGFFCAGSKPGPDYSVSVYLQEIFGLDDAAGWLPPAVLSFRTDPF